MRTQNVKVQTAGEETAGRCGEGQKPSQKMAFVQAEAGVIFSHAMLHEKEWVSRWGMQTLAVLQRLYPDMLLLPVEEALALANSKHRTSWVEITEERYVEQLEMLMPMDWHRTTAGESFKCMEMIEDVTRIFARKDGRFFECNDLCTLNHQEIMCGVDAVAGSLSLNAGH